MIEREAIQAARNDATSALLEAVRHSTWTLMETGDSTQVFKTYVDKLKVTMTRVPTGSNRATITLAVGGMKLGLQGSCRLGDDYTHGNGILADIWANAERAWLTDVIHRAEGHARKAEKNQTDISQALTAMLRDIPARPQIDRIRENPQEGEISHHVQFSGSTVAYLRAARGGYRWEAFGHEGNTDTYSVSVSNLYIFLIRHLVPLAHKAGIEGRHTGTTTED